MSVIDIDQARRRAKELLKAARAGDIEALARCPRRHDPVTLADAQLAIARELGYPSWPRLLAAAGWTRAQHADVDWSRVRRVTVVPFLDDGRVVVPEDGLPTGAVLPGEDVVRDACLRIPMESAGFRRQGTHVFALGEGGSHVGVWVSGERYATGGARKHKADSIWWTGPASEVDDPLVVLADEARRSLTIEEHRQDELRILEPTYLAADTPQGGSGFGGTAQEWRDQRSQIVDAIDVDGDFLDVGCANGHLMECVVSWCADKGVAVEPYGLDISPKLVALARRRLPAWADRIWVGDALSWRPPRRFDVVHTLLDLAPPAHRHELLTHLLATSVAPGGRLVVSSYSPANPARDVVAALGFTVDGETRAPTRGGVQRGHPSVWISRQP